MESVSARPSRTAAARDVPRRVGPPRRGRLLWWLPALAVAAGIFLLSEWSLSGWWRRPQPEWRIRGMDKVAHGALYATLSASLYLALRRGHGVSPGRAAVLALGAAALYGVTDEIHQLFVPERNAEVRDWLADLIGASIGAAVARRGRRLRPRAGRLLARPRTETAQARRGSGRTRLSGRRRAGPPTAAARSRAGRSVPDRALRAVRPGRGRAGSGRAEQPGAAPPHR